MQKQMWHRSNHFQNRENFWKEFFSRATENNQFWFTNNGSGCTGTEEHSLLVRSARTASLKTLGVDPGWRFYCSSRCPELCPRAASLSLNVQPWHLSQRCLRLTFAGWDSADEQQLSLSAGSPRGLWQMRWKSLTLREIKRASISIVFLHQFSFFLHTLKHTSKKLH